MDDNQCDYEVECGDCGSYMTLFQYQGHNCQQASQAQGEASSQPQSEGEDNFVQILAESVQARPGLWDHTLPLKDRAKDVKERLWREVYFTLNEKWSIQFLEKKWRNLKDTFLKHLKTYKPSGAGVEDYKKWKHFDALFFLAEKNMPKRTISNLASSSILEIEQELLSPSGSTTSSRITAERTPTIKRHKKNADADQLLVDILKEPPPKSAPARTISAALLAAEAVLDKLPTRIRMQAEIDILNKVYALHAEYTSDD